MTRYDSLLQAVGDTPLVGLPSLSPAPHVRLWAKLEDRNPTGSVKDRVALHMVRAAEEEGRLKPGDTILEPTSGNTGIGLAMVAAARGYRLILTMPEDMTLERHRLLARFGAELIVTPAIEGMSGAVFAAQELVDRHPDYFMPAQFDNPANPAVHRDTTAEEIWTATEGRVDALVVGVGTGGTITGVGQVLKQRRPAVKVVAVEPARSPVLAGGRPRPHAIQGIGASFVPSVLDREVIDELIAVTDEDACAMALRLTREEGLLVGVSAGANVWAAAAVAARLRTEQVVVTMLPDTGERYLSMEW